MTEQLFLILQKELKLLQDAADVLQYSFDKCGRIGLKQSYHPEELESFESFTGRFARLSDILVQKVFRLIDEIDLDAQGTVRDRINRAEKKGLIGSSDTFVEIRMVRNDIAHQYLSEAIHETFAKVLELTPALLDSVERVKVHSRKYQ
ncbi:hypothetical protein [Geomonas edaphica]|uniref:hypothetical protein n=1 Tax=Geomonas edaphica TaxID=2570226 RepID=UPI0010A7B9B6|nr:hypothetical protein [Geomonas edaphica]